MSVFKDQVFPVVYALIGCYCASWGMATFSIASLTYFGVDFHTAETGVFIVAFIFSLALFLWAFSRPAFWLTNTTTYLAGALLTGLGLWLQALILN